MALALPPMAMEVNVLDIATKIFESEAGPTLKLGVSLNLPIAELLQALQQFQNKSREPVQAPKAKQQEAKEASLQPPMQPGLVRPGADTGSDASPAPVSHPPSAEDAKPGATMAITHASAYANSATNQHITWENEIADLHSGATNTLFRWEPTSSHRNWILPEEAQKLETLKIQRFKWTPLPPKAPTQPDAGLAEKATAALEKALAIPRPQEVETQLPPSAPPPSSGGPPGLPPAMPPPDSTHEAVQGSEGGGAWSPPVPPAAAPPPAPGATAAAGAPPGLSAPNPPATASRRGAPPGAAPGAAPGGGNGDTQASSPGGPAADGKECKQQ